MVFWLVAPVCIDGMERRPSANTSVDVYGARGVETGGITEAVAAGADNVVLVSLATGTTKDLYALGTC